MSSCIVVLGMHRSFTSLIAKGLVSNNINMGDYYVKRDEFNPLGYYEDIDFLRLNKYILLTAGGDWRYPPSEEKILSLNDNKNITDKIKNLISKKQTKKIWGWKDPRTILTIRLFEPYLKNPVYIACYRNPEEVAKSLQKRNGISIEEGTALAKLYNYRMKKFLDDHYGDES